MPSKKHLQKALNRTVLIVFIVELAIWGVWSQFFMQSPFGSPFVQPVIELSADIGQIVFGCISVACIPYVFAGVVIFLYGIAVIITNLYGWADNRFQADLT